MSVLQGQVSRFAVDETGATAIEYGLIAALIAVGLIVAMTLFGGGVTAMFEYVSTKAAAELDNTGR